MKKDNQARRMIFMIFGRIRFRGVNKEIIQDDAHISDYQSAEKIGRVSLGRLCFYYRDLGKKYCVPYDYIDRSFTRISEVQPDDSPAYYYYRLILVHGEKEFANLIFNKEEEVDKIHERLKEFNPSIQYGYIPSEKSSKPKFR